MGTKLTSEFFNTAGRDIKMGLTASVIVSQWTWAATLLQSSNVAWQFGVSGPFWYASGATIQVLLFGILAIEVKRRAPLAVLVPQPDDVFRGRLTGRGWVGARGERRVSARVFAETKPVLRATRRRSASRAAR